MLRMRPVRSYASRNVMLPRVNQQQRHAQSMLSKRAPVRHQRLAHVCARFHSAQPSQCRT